IIVVSAASAIEVGTEQAWVYCEEAGLARIIFINKMDRENADFDKSVEQLQARFGGKCLPLQLPVGAHESFKGIVDLLSMKYHQGEKGAAAEIPAEVKEQAEAMREKMVETIAEVDDVLIEKYLGGEEISAEELEIGLKQAVISSKIVPVLAGSGLQNVAAGKLLDAVCNYLPSSNDNKIITTEDSRLKDIEAGAESPLASLVFKTTADPYVGKLTYFRVFSGSIDSNSHIWNVTRNSEERIGQLFVIKGKNQEAVEKIGAGDIGAVAKLGITVTGDTLGSQEKPVKIEPATFPASVYRVAVHPKTKADLDKLGSALTRLTEEDPTLHMHRDADTNETILSGLGDTQLDAAAEKMQRKFGVGVELTMPKVPYKETITQPSRAEYKHRKQSGGHGQYGHVRLELAPLERESGNVFVSNVVGGSIPKNYIPAVEKGVNEAIKEGVLAGFPVIDVKANVYDGSFHPVDSSEICFKIAGSGAFRRGLSEGAPILLEPIMNIKIVVPNDFTGDIISDLNTKRARVQGVNPVDGNNVIEAQAPLAEVLHYAIDLKSITQGKGTFSMEASHYEEVPAHISQKIIAEREAKREAEKS
ncbi:elongation factor G, partial [Chloroflexota bacterium]